MQWGIGIEIALRHFRRERAEAALEGGGGPLESRGRGGVRRPLFEREAPDQFETESLKTGRSQSRRYWLQPYYCPSVVVCLKWERGGVGLLRGGRKTRRDFCLWLSREKQSWEQTGWIFLMDGQRRLFLSGQSASAAESRRPSISLSIKADRLSRLADVSAADRRVQT